ncbi:MAG: CAP domain-containing protein [Methyloceanibacter sp.]
MIALACMFFLAQGCAAPVVAVTPVEYRGSGLNAQAALAEVNAFRRKHGLKPLVLDQRLNRAAAVQSQAQARRGKIGHQGADGSKPRQRAERAGYKPNLTAENVASGQKSFSQAMRGWERSPDHKRNLLLPSAEAAGIAVSYRNGRAYYTLVLGSER